MSKVHCEYAFAENPMVSNRSGALLRDNALRRWKEKEGEEVTANGQRCMIDSVKIRRTVDEDGADVDWPKVIVEGEILGKDGAE